MCAACAAAVLHAADVGMHAVLSIIVSIQQTAKDGIVDVHAESRTSPFSEINMQGL